MNLYNYLSDQLIASSILSSPQKSSFLTIKDGLPKILFTRAEFVFSVYFSFIIAEFASEIISSFFKFNSAQTSEILGSIAGSLPS